MSIWVNLVSATTEQEHQWVQFYNPRNKRVTITACARCGIAKSSSAGHVVCESLSKDTHHMRKMGWRLKDVNSNMRLAS